MYIYIYNNNNILGNTLITQCSNYKLKVYIFIFLKMVFPSRH